MALITVVWGDTPTRPVTCYVPAKAYTCMPWLGTPVLYKHTGRLVRVFTMAERISALEEKVDFLASTLDTSVQRLTEAIAKLHASTPAEIQPDDLQLEGPNQANVEAPHQAQVDTPAPRPDVPTSGSPSTGAPPLDVQGEFAAVRDCYKKVKFPPDLRLSESRTGIRREDQPAFNIVSRSWFSCEL